jgi:hypothetical protein
VGSADTELFIFPGGAHRKYNPSKPVTSLKTVNVVIQRGLSGLFASRISADRSCVLMQRAQHVRAPLPVAFERDCIGTAFVFDEVGDSVLRCGSRDDEDVWVPSRASQRGATTCFVVERSNADAFDGFIHHISDAVKNDLFERVEGDGFSG